MISFGPMKRFRFCVCIVPLLLVSCSDQNLGAGAWSPPQEVARSSDSLSSSLTLYKWNGSVLALGGDDGTYAARVLDESDNLWKSVSTDNSGGPTVDAAENRFVVVWGTLSADRLDVESSTRSLSPEGRFITAAAGALSLRKGELFPEAPPNLYLLQNENRGPVRIGFAGGVIERSEIRIPYCIDATPKEGRVWMLGKAVSANGVFASSDQGRSWRAEPIIVRQSQSPLVCQTEGFYYYFARTWLGGIPYELWCSRCPLKECAWSQPETLNKSGANKLSEGLHAVGEKDVVHLCWLDARHEKTRFSLNRPCAENYEVAYCNRQDSDSKWCKDVILSKGHRWSYAPTMSVEGSNLVVAWAGANGWADRNEYGPSDIYYVTSKDGGKTWTKPIRVTHGANSGITSGRPQVALHKGVIHLFYIQGTLNYKQVSAGMVKLNQPPWPIYYQHRQFPP